MYRYADGISSNLKLLGEVIDRIERPSVWILSMQHWLYIALGVILGTAVLYWVGEFLSPATSFWR